MRWRRHFQILALLSDPLPTVCSSDCDIIDETETKGRVFSAVMARRPNNNKGGPRGFGRARDRRFHDGVNCFTYCAESTLNRVQRRRTHYASIQNESEPCYKRTEQKDLDITVQVALWKPIWYFRLAI